MCDTWSTGQFKRIHPAAQAHSLLNAQIDHILRLRVLQELDLLADRLLAAPLSLESHVPVLRRFTRAEWHAARESELLTGTDAGSTIALLIVPKVQKSRLAAADSNNIQQPPLSMDHPVSSRAAQAPMSILFRVPTTLLSSTNLSQTLSPHLVPVYNGPALFPSPIQRASLRSHLDRILKIERDAAFNLRRNSSDTPGRALKKGEREKSSDVYVLRSDKATLGRAETVGVAVALWRLRMWEGMGWESDAGWGLT